MISQLVSCSLAIPPIGDDYGCLFLTAAAELIGDSLQVMVSSACYGTDDSSHPFNFLFASKLLLIIAYFGCDPNDLQFILFDGSVSVWTRELQLL